MNRDTINTIGISDILMTVIVVTAPWLLGNVKGSLETWITAGVAGYAILYSLSSCLDNLMFIAQQRYRRYINNLVPCVNPLEDRPEEKGEIR